MDDGDESAASALDGPAYFRAGKVAAARFHTRFAIHELHLVFSSKLFISRDRAWRCDPSMLRMMEKTRSMATLDVGRLPHHFA